MKISQSIALFCFLLIATIHHSNALVTHLVNFNQLVQAVENGFDVRAMISFNQCYIANPEIEEDLSLQLEGASILFTFSQFFHIKQHVNARLLDAVSTTKKSFIESPSGKFYTLFSRLSVFEDNSATVHMVVFDAILHKKRWAVDWFCNINNRFNTNLQNNVVTNTSNIVQTNLRNNVPTNLQTIQQTNFRSPLQPSIQDSLNSQDNQGLVLFNFF